jgi:hypothetical protein
MKHVPVFLLLVLLLSSCAANAQDSLRGSNGPFRKGWDVLHYDLNIGITVLEYEGFFKDKKGSIYCETGIDFCTIDEGIQKIQLDLQEPMHLRACILGTKEEGFLHEVSTKFFREGNVYWVTFSTPLKKDKKYHLFCISDGIPREAQNPPWDGGFVWKKDKNGTPWVAVACQGDGASLWFPCKDFQADEPDSGVTLRIHNSENLPTICNGQLISGTLTNNPVWQVKSSINPYNITFYIGDYIGWTDTFNGVSGKLPLSFYALRENEAKARKQFAVVPQMLRCYEEKVGPYPFYADGYKLVEAPYLGMEHQSAVAYGNEYRMGYRGMDRSGTGVGNTFDYIIIHESGHEWFGNSITAADVADNWIHEGFTTYLENVFVECASGPGATKKYLLGERRNIRNDQPIIGRYGVFDEGSGDKYDKGATIVGMLRAMHPDDAAFWTNFRTFYARFAHSTVTSAQVEAWWSEALGRNLQPFFDLYLRSTAIPKLEFRKENSRQEVRLTHVGNGFSLPLFYDASGKPLEVSDTWQPIGKKRDPRPEFLLEE